MERHTFPSSSRGRASGASTSSTKASPTVACFSDPDTAAAADSAVPASLAALAADGEPLQLPGFHDGAPLAAEGTADAEPSSLCSSVSSEAARSDSKTGSASPEMPHVVRVHSLGGRRPPPPSSSASVVSTDGGTASLPPPRYTPVKITTVVWQSRTLTRAEALERARVAQARARERRAAQQQQQQIKAN